MVPPRGSLRCSVIPSLNIGLLDDFFLENQALELDCPLFDAEYMRLYLFEDENFCLDRTKLRAKFSTWPKPFSCSCFCPRLFKRTTQVMKIANNAITTAKSSPKIDCNDEFSSKISQQSPVQIPVSFPLSWLNGQTVIRYESYRMTQFDRALSLARTNCFP